jgi:hypothetical protein
LQRLAEARDIDLEAVLRARGGPLTPEFVDQAVSRDDLVRVQDQKRQQCTVLSATEEDWTTLDLDLERPEKPKLHAHLLLDVVPS